MAKSKSKTKRTKKPAKKRGLRSSLRSPRPKRCTGSCRLRTAGMGFGEIRVRTHGKKVFEITRVK